MVIWHIPLIIGILSALFFLAERAKRHSVKALFLKAFTSLAFVATAVCAWFSSGKDNPFGIFIIIGLTFGLLGDIWLDLKFIYPAEDSYFTRAGFTVFGIGHIFYIAGLLYCFDIRESPLHVIIPVALAVIIGICVVLLEKPMKMEYGKMKKYVLLYGIVLFMTVLLYGSAALKSSFGDTTLVMIFAGSVLFALSDLVLNGTYFGKGKDKPVHIVINHILYFAGQFVIACSLAFLAK